MHLVDEAWPRSRRPLRARDPVSVREGDRWLAHVERPAQRHRGCDLASEVDRIDVTVVCQESPAANDGPEEQCRRCIDRPAGAGRVRDDHDLVLGRLLEPVEEPIFREDAVQKREGRLVVLADVDPRLELALDPKIVTRTDLVEDRGGDLRRSLVLEDAGALVVAEQLHLGDDAERDPRLVIGAERPNACRHDRTVNAAARSAIEAPDGRAHPFARPPELGGIVSRHGEVDAREIGRVDALADAQPERPSVDGPVREGELEWTYLCHGPRR